MERTINKFEAYLLTEKRVSQSTLEAYMRDLRQLFLYLKGEHRVTLKKATREHLKGFLFFLKKKKCSSARTMSRKISAIKVFYTYARTYMGWKNIAGDLTFPKLEKKLPQYLTEQEIEKLFEIADQDTTLVGERNKIMLYLLYVSGMRISEMVNLQVSQVQSDSGFINVSGKGGKGRVIPIPKPMMQKLDGYIEHVLPKLVNMKKVKKKKSNYLFPVMYAGKVKTISRQAFWVILKKIWAKTGSKRSISPHQMRHSLATHMLKKGVDLRSLQMLLGHENLSTVQIYTHLDIGYLRDVYDKKHPRA
ncbi:tyrosine-type recombinase/integrase [Candidatus Dependentiae bacterium]